MRQLAESYILINEAPNGGYQITFKTSLRATTLPTIIPDLQTALIRAQLLRDHLKHEVGLVIPEECILVSGNAMKANSSNDLASRKAMRYIEPFMKGGPK